jgi:hypothetical protein
MNAIERMRARARRTAWWSDRWAWRGALAAAPLGALAAILHALLVLRTGWEEALVLYAIGAMVAAGIGCLLGGPLGGAVQSLRDSRSAGRRRRTGTQPCEAPPAEQDLDSMLHGPRAAAA